MVSSFHVKDGVGSERWRHLCGKIPSCIAWHSTTEGVLERAWWKHKKQKPLLLASSFWINDYILITIIWTLIILASKLWMPVLPKKTIQMLVLLCCRIQLFLFWLVSREKCRFQFSYLWHKPCPLLLFSIKIHLAEFKY